MQESELACVPLRALPRGGGSRSSYRLYPLFVLGALALLALLLGLAYPKHPS